MLTSIVNAITTPVVALFNKTNGSSPYLTAKSVVIDIADNHGDGSFVGIRQIDFWLGGEKLEMDETSDFLAYATTYYDLDYHHKWVFDTDTLKTGNGWTETQWLADNTYITNQRLVITFTSPIGFDEIRVTNFHAAGTYSARGAKNAKIFVSTDAITSTVYGEFIPNSSLIIDGEFNKHSSIDEPDEQIFTWDSFITCGLYHTAPPFTYYTFGVSLTGQFSGGQVDYDPGGDISICKVGFNVGRGSGDLTGHNYVVEIWTTTGSGTGLTLVAKQGVSSTVVAGVNSWNNTRVDWVFNTPVSLNGGTKYAILLSPETSGDVSPTNYPRIYRGDINEDSVISGFFAIMKYDGTMYGTEDCDCGIFIFTETPWS